MAKDRTKEILEKEGTPESNIRQPGGEQVELRIVSKEEAFETARKAGGTPPTQKEIDRAIEEQRGGTTTKVVGKEEAFRTAAEAGGVPPSGITTRVFPTEGGTAGTFRGTRTTQPTVEKEPTTLIGRAFETIREFIPTIPAQKFTDPFTGKELETKSVNVLQFIGLFGAARGGVGLFSKEAAATLKTSTAAGKTTIAQVLKMTGGAGYAVNTATKTITHKMLIRAGFTVAAALFIGAVTSYPFADFLNVSEAVNQTIGGARWQAVKSGNTEMVEGLNQLQDEILNPTGWNRVWANTPYINIIEANKNIVKAALASTKVYDKIIEDIQIQEETGETEDAKWERVRQEETDQEKEVIDYYNEQRKLMVRWENEAKAAEREDNAKFWAAERAKQRELEEADRQAVADFWMAYRKRAQELADNNRPSNLNFGLL